MKLFKIITIFPEFFETPLKSSLLGKAVSSGIIKVEIIDLKSYAEDKFYRVDDYSYGGGSGMVLKPEPLFKAIKANSGEKTKILLTTPSGILMTHNVVKELEKEEDLCIICGHFEGVDQRVIDRFVDYEISIGDYVLSGGEYAALVIIDSIARLQPGFMSNPDSLSEESFESGLLEYPHYTRPADIEGLKVPDILISGHHGMIKEWRLNQSKEKTSRIRPDLYKKYISRQKEGDEK
ncbi:MAG: tRNA (guanosine(37)-N1)-methyltransferase TrmD [Spirochaetes bacterium]|nr:tRNA (guanosine(37)-N1)-methyltransferase TrmD [Spirochaetota bacterium]